MTNKITLANGKSFNAEAGQTILVAASKDGFSLEHSCRTGRCGVCKTRVISGETETHKPEESLSEHEACEGFILTCCRTALTDLQLDVEDLSELGNIQVKTLPCRIDSLKHLSADVVEVTLRVPPSSRLEYVPGQYADIIGKDGVRRSYSVANAPREDGKISLQIRKVENGQMSQYWFNDARVSDLLRMEGPLGTFCLRENAASNLILLATGTGIAPIKAILEQLSESPECNTYRHIHLYWGGRTAQDIYWQPDFPSLSLSFTPVLSRANDGKTHRGYVQQAVINEGPNLKDAVVYACGSEMMIRSAHEQLVTAGLNTRHFYSDAFVSSN